jgi:hypothetical protein
VVRYHPAIRQIHRLIELNCHDLGVHLHDNAFQPTAYAVALVIFMVAVHFNTLANAINVLAVGSGSKS